MSWIPRRAGAIALATAVGALIAASVFIRARGAASVPGVASGVPPSAPPTLRDGERIEFGAGAADPYLGAGWGQGEGAYRWTLGRRAEVLFKRAGTGGRLLELTMHPFLPPGDAATQRVFFDLNGRLVAPLTLQAPTPRRHVLALAADALRDVNVLGLTLPDARSPNSVGLGADRRPLGIAMHTVTLRPFPVLAPGDPIPWGSPAAEPYLGDGWSVGEGLTRWNDGVTATILFAAADAAGGATLVFDWEPFATAAVPNQSVRMTCNDVPLGTFTLVGPVRRGTPVPIPPSALKAENVLVLAFPGARSPALIRQSNDTRLLAVRVHSVQLKPAR